MIMESLFKRSVPNFMDTSVRSFTSNPSKIEICEVSDEATKLLK